jgi:hypothetical protein
MASISISPNPAHDKISNYSTDPIMHSLAIYDLIGRTLLTENLSVWIYTISIAHLSAGTYIVEAITDQGVRRTKLEVLK